MLSRNLARLQEERRETNYRLAKELGVHQTSIQNWKNGTIPHPKHIKLIADHFGVTVDALFAEDDKASEAEQ